MILSPFPTIVIHCVNCASPVRVPKGQRKQFCGKPECRKEYERRRYAAKKERKNGLSRVLGAQAPTR